MSENKLLPPDREVTEKTSLEKLRTCFSRLKIHSDDITRIAIAFQQFLFLREESIDNYPNIQDWIEHWQTHGYHPSQIIDMIELGKELPKYGKARLALGDLITNWKKQKEETLGIAWHEFDNALRKILETDKLLIDNLSIETVGIPFMTAAQRNYNKDYIIDIRSKTAAEITKCSNTRRQSISELLTNSENLYQADKLIIHDRLVFMRSLLYELEHTSRQPLRVLKKRIDDLELEYRSYFKDNTPTPVQELCDMLHESYQYINGYLPRDSDIVDFHEKFGNVLRKYFIIKPVFEKEKI